MLYHILQKYYPKESYNFFLRSIISMSCGFMSLRYDASSNCGWWRRTPDVVEKVRERERDCQ